MSFRFPDTSLSWDQAGATPLEDIRAASRQLRRRFEPLVAFVGPDHWIAKDPEAQAELRAQGWDLVILGP